MKIDILTHTLSNGMKVVFHPHPTTAMVAVDILYNVGSRDESPTRSGMAHLFEHLMFGGSENVARFDRASELAGAENNAWTSCDYTNFYDILPASNIESAFWFESDRMLSPRLDPEAIEIQKSVVIEEFKQTCLNQPYGDLSHHLLGMVYSTHPYSRPTIGLTPDDVAAVTPEDARQFFDSHYAPNNAVLAVAGNTDFDTVVKLAEKWFGSIPARPVAPRLYMPEPAFTEPRRKVVTGAVPHAQITLAFPMGGIKSEDFYPADMLSDVLANGRSSRLLRNVVRGNDLISSADASIRGTEEPGFLMVNATLQDSSPQSVSRAEKILWRELEEIATHAVSETELEKCRNRFESNFTFNTLSYFNTAEELALHTVAGRDINETVPLYREVTSQRLLETASRLIRPENCATLVYLPE